MSVSVKLTGNDPDHISHYSDLTTSTVSGSCEVQIRCEAGSACYRVLAGSLSPNNRYWKRPWDDLTPYLAQGGIRWHHALKA